MKPTILLTATYDTKGRETEFIKNEILSQGVDCITINVGVGEQPVEEADVSLYDLCKNTQYEGQELMSLPRGQAVAIVSEVLERYVSLELEQEKFHAILGLGGAGGTQIITQAMRALPYGIPKIMLTTLASGNTRWYVQDSDIVMFPSITDIAGLNSFSRMIYSKFAHAGVSGATWYARRYKLSTMWKL